MAPATPSFGDLKYWNTRFSHEENFDWLADYGVLEPWLRKIVDAKSAAGDGVCGRDGKGDTRPQVLHIGCGNSNLSMQLRGLVESAEQLHNIDYSNVVIERGRQREEDSLGRGAISSRWSTLDLLSLDQILEFRRGGDGYDVIIDKSTSDAISCAEDVEISLPYRINTTTSDYHASLEMSSVYPPYILAIHLAYLATPGCHWVVLSYSSSRFESWEDEKLPDGLPYPGKLWKLVTHEKIIQPPDPEDKVHRPPETHHLYILERTEVELKVL